MFKSILVAVDGSVPSDKSIETACDIGAKYNAKLYIVHVIEDFIMMPESIGAVDYAGQDIGHAYLETQSIREIIVEQAEANARRCGITDIETAILHGSPAGKIVEFAKDKNVDLIILGSHGLGSIASLLMGSVSGKVCHLADRTCMTVR